MNIDIEKLSRKTPYPEPSDEFFKTLQNQVISKTLGEKIPVTQKEAKVFSLNFKWFAAAAVVLIAGITAFFGINDKPEVPVALQKPIVDSIYEYQQPKTMLTIESQDNAMSAQASEHKDETEKNHQSVARLSKSNSVGANRYDNTDRQDYAIENNRKPETEVEKVLAAFTPDQLKDLDKNSEQDVYLDLYN